MDLENRRFREMQPNNEISYSPREIYDWARWVLENPEYEDRKIRDFVGDMLFQYFINTKSLDPSNKYFICRNKSRMYLRRDRGETQDTTIHDYIITTRADGIKHASQKRMTGYEAALLDSILNEHSIDHAITDIMEIRCI